jgi:general nucleoside transport system permease protein
MADEQKNNQGAFAMVANGWQRIAPSLVPLFAVLTALIITIPLMIVTGGKGDIGRGLYIAGSAYSSLLEGSLGLAINDLASADDLALAQTLAEQESLTQRGLRGWSSDVSAVSNVGLETLRRYAAVLESYPDLTDEAIDELGSRVPDIAVLGQERLQALTPLVEAFGELDRGDVRDLAARVGALETLSADDRTELETLAPPASELDDAALLAAMQLIDQEGIVKLGRLLEQIAVLGELELSAESDIARDIGGMAEVEAAKVRELVAVVEALDQLGITDTEELFYQLRFTGDLYANDLLTEDDVATAITQELDEAGRNNLIVRRPGQVDRILVAPGDSAAAGIIWSDNKTPDNLDDDRPSEVFLRLGGSTLIFLPSNLETMIVRSIPFIVAGLAVAIGFKAGLFNIGASGQLYIGATMAAWVGFAGPDIFTGILSAINIGGILDPLLPITYIQPWIHLPLVLIMGIIGGALWGAIPGILKAYTGANEVINTIMLNFIAIRLVEWLIKSKDPLVLRDPTASVDQTPNLLETARLTIFSEIGLGWFILAGLLTAVWGLWQRREKLQANWLLAIRPVINGLLVFLGGIFLAWTTVRWNLHLGLVVMIGAVWFAGWFLDRTTLGFELRTVGANPDAARYAGMNVRWNIILALALSGAFAGLAGTIEVAGVQHNMKPDFFAGLGFDAIAVALLARSNPRNMIPAGLLWGALLAGAGLMQVRANISIDLVKIIQALIIMFIAADAIIRYLWRVRKATPDEMAAAMFSKGWGG